MLRRATVDDIDRLLEFTRPYFEETAYKNKLTYSNENSRLACRIIVTNANMFLYEHDGEILGISAVSFSKTFFEELEAEFEFFFIKEEYRGSGIARLLVEFCTDFAKQSGASIIYAASNSGMSDKNDKLWCNLFRKFGYEFLGSQMFKFLR